MRRLWILIACMIGSPLVAETIGSVDFQFPPSNYEWILLTDHDSLSYEDPDEEDEDIGTITFKIFTHREGDALELFTAMVQTGIDSEDDDDEDDEFETTEMTQEFLNEHFGRYFPNHQFVILKNEETDQEQFMEWEWRDGIQDIMHGFSRVFIVDDRMVAFSYMTTATKNEYNSHLWTQVLNQIKVN